MRVVRALTEEERGRLKEALGRLGEAERSRLQREAEAMVDEEPRCPLCRRLFISREALRAHGGRKHGGAPVDELLLEFHLARLLGIA